MMCLCCGCYAMYTLSFLTSHSIVYLLFIVIDFIFVGLFVVVSVFIELNVLSSFIVFFCRFFFFKQKTAYEMRISDWSSDVCSSDLRSMRLPIRNRALQTIAQLSAISSTISAAAVLCRSRVDRMGRSSMVVSSVLVGAHLGAMPFVWDQSKS